MVTFSKQSGRVFMGPRLPRRGHALSPSLLYNPAMHRALVLTVIGLLSSLAHANIPSWELQTGGGWHLTTAPTPQPIHEETLDPPAPKTQHGQIRPPNKEIVGWRQSHKA